MADEPRPRTGVVSREVSWHLADGTPTDDPNKAVSAEVTTTYADGRVEHRLMERANQI